MITFNAIRSNLLQIYAITEKNIKLNIRFKYSIVFTFINPIIWVLMPLIVMGQLFEFSDQFGLWTVENYLVFQFIAYNIYLLKDIVSEFPGQLGREKFWKTLPALMIAPFNRFNLLFGIFLSRLFLISIPFVVFFVICCIIIPISIPTILFIIGIFCAIALIFSGIGLIIGVFTISNENIANFLSFSLSLIFWASCISYPFEIFPGILQTIINLNPLYYIFEILRIGWVDNNPLITISSNPFPFFILITCLISLPCIGVFIFNRVFKKYGIVGY